jgi:hypothetical protein
MEKQKSEEEKTVDQKITEGLSAEQIKELEKIDD